MFAANNEFLSHDQYAVATKTLCFLIALFSILAYRRGGSDLLRYIIIINWIYMNRIYLSQAIAFIPLMSTDNIPQLSAYLTHWWTHTSLHILAVVDRASVVVVLVSVNHLLNRRLKERTVENQILLFVNSRKYRIPWGNAQVARFR